MKSVPHIPWVEAMHVFVVAGPHRRSSEHAHNSSVVMIWMMR